MLQVFIPEQVAYSKPDLERHMRTGDLTGPMAESGFKGHPQCRSATHGAIKQKLSVIARIVCRVDWLSHGVLAVNLQKLSLVSRPSM